jgi:4-amino-4-deoxy-L-arabinose transferase-like glycosyltransferase
LLTRQQAFWANILFVLSPLSVFFGQAFMPEMCIQFFAFCMLSALLLYRESGSLSHYLLFAAAGLLGLLVKSLEITHLYAVALIVFWQREGAKLFLRPHHWIGGIITLASLLAWVRYVDGVNQPFFPEWTASELSRRFLGTWPQRLDWHFYFKVTAYLAAFVAGPVGLMIGVVGVFQRNSRNTFGFW